MTASNEAPLSLAAKLRLADETYSIELATAVMLGQADGLLQRAFEASGMTLEQAAEKLSLPIERLEEIMSSQGNLRISTFARVMRGFGCVIKLNMSEETIDKKGQAHQTPINATSRAIPKDRVTRAS